MKDLKDSRFARARFALARIQSAAPATKEANFIFAKFAQAVSDVVVAREGRGYNGVITALIYLSAPEIHELSLLGIETDWALEQLDKMRVFA